MDANQALVRLLAHPRTFLTTHAVTVTVNGGDPSGARPFAFAATGLAPLHGDLYDRTRGTAFLGGLGGLFKGTKAFKFFPPNLLGALGVQGDVVYCDAVLVAVTPSTGLNFGQLPVARLSAGQGPSLMVTTLLNGCTFAIAPHGNDLLCAHVRPTGGMTAGFVATQVANQGAFVGHGGVALTIFGHQAGYDRNTEDSTVLGVRRNGRWNIYAQVQSAQQGPKNVRRVVRIFEG